MSSTTLNAPARTGLLAHAMMNFQSYRARAEIRRRTARELSALSDRELADIGISRYDIQAVALEAANA